MGTSTSGEHNAVSFMRADPLTSLLIGRLHLRPWLVTLGVSLVLNIPILVVATISDLWFGTAGRIGLLQDYGWWVFQLSSVPGSVLFFFWMSQGIRDVLDGLQENRVIGAPIAQEVPDVGFKSFSDFERRFYRSYSHWAWLLLCGVAAVAFIVLVVPVHRTYNNWVSANVFAFWYIELFWALLCFMACLLVIRCGIVIVWLNRLFRGFDIDVRILHSDGAGGLAPLGSFSVKIGYLIGVYGLAVVAATLTQSYLVTGRFSGLTPNLPLILVFFAYLIASPIAFFAPIGSAHTAMRKAKHSFILQVSEQFEADFARMRSLLSSDAEELEKGIKKVKQLREIHEMTTRFPVWPFNIESLVRFFSSILSPFVLALVPTIIDLLIP